jgi:hypothetical protein
MATQTVGKGRSHKKKKKNKKNATYGGKRAGAPYFKKQPGH